MILKASQRGGGGDLARHLLKTEENEHVELYELRGFVADDLRGAFQEAYALSKGTRCRQFLFSLSLNPPPEATVSDRQFKTALRMVEQELGLTGQPRAVVFHEKEGRRHAHCVWSRIDADSMTAINLPHFKNKLREISRELYIKNNWRMPKGLIDRKDRSPLNFSREQWQQAKRTGLDPQTAKKLFQDCWAASDSREAFSRALEERGFWLARGDRRGFVAVDFWGEVYSVARMIGAPTKTVNGRLGDPANLPTVEQTKARIAAQMTATIRAEIREAERGYALQGGGLMLHRRDMVRRHRQERQKLREHQNQRWQRETNERAARLRKGLRGLWDWLTGRHSQTKRHNERDAFLAHQRDQAERQQIVARQLAERRALQTQIQAFRKTHVEQTKALYRDVAHYVRMNADQRQPLRDQFRQAARAEALQSTAKRGRPPIALDRSPENSRGRRRRRPV